MVAKTAKTVKVVRSTKAVRVVKPAGRTGTGNAKPVPSFPRAEKAVNPWAPTIAKDFKDTGVRTSRVPQHTKPGGAALTIQRGGGAATKVGGAAAVRADRVAKKRGEVAAAKKTKVAVPQKPEKPLKFSKKSTVSIDATSIKAIAKLVKLQLEGKPITKRKQYPTRSSTIVRVPNEILELVKQQIAAYRRRKAEK